MKQAMVRESRACGGSELAVHWGLDAAVDYLNHGSFGACPTAVLEAQARWQRRIEREPVQFLHRELEQHLDRAREALARFVGAPSDDLAFVPNATAGINTVLRSLRFEAGDEIVVTDQEYNATRNAVDFVAHACGARVVAVALPFPIASPDVVLERVLAAITARTKLLVVDHITSPTGLVLPIERLVRAARERGVETLVDGAHGPGHVALSLEALGAAYYTGNCHKWMCTPKGSALLYVRRDLQAQIRPLAISHGANSRRTDRSFFRLEADWPGTHDPTPWLVIPEALEHLAQLVPGGWDEIRRRNRQLALWAREHLCAALGVALPAPESMIGCLAALPLPDRTGPASEPLGLDPLHVALYERHGIEIPVFPWPAPPRRLIRLSAQLYNRREQYERLARVLRAELNGARA
jgi:isopenicillin-N epimerase